MPTKKVVVQVFPRNKYPATVAGKTIFPRDRKRLGAAIGAADQMYLQTRLFARDTNVTLNFTLVQGCYGDEPPSEGPRQFTLTNSGTSPSLPYDSTNMPSLPDDGMFYVEPKMGNVDIQGLCAGAVGSIEFEMWATLIYNG